MNEVYGILGEPNYLSDGKNTGSNEAGKYLRKVVMIHL